MFLKFHPDENLYINLDHITSILLIDHSSTFESTNRVGYQWIFKKDLSQLEFASDIDITDDLLYNYIFPSQIFDSKQEAEAWFYETLGGYVVNTLKH